MAYEHKEGSGALFTNDKGDNPARPDYRGDLMIGGKLYEISGWIKPVASNPAKRFLSLAAKPKQGKEKPAQRPSHDAARARDTGRASPTGFDDFDDPIPF